MIHIVHDELLSRSRLDFVLDDIRERGCAVVSRGLNVPREFNDHFIPARSLVSVILRYTLERKVISQPCSAQPPGARSLPPSSLLGRPRQPLLHPWPRSPETLESAVKLAYAEVLQFATAEASSLSHRMSRRRWTYVSTDDRFENSSAPPCHSSYSTSHRFNYFLSYFSFVRFVFFFCYRSENFAPSCHSPFSFVFLSLTVCNYFFTVSICFLFFTGLKISPTVVFLSFVLIIHPANLFIIFYLCLNILHPLLLSFLIHPLIDSIIFFLFQFICHLLKILPFLLFIFLFYHYFNLVPLY